jgi:hypothetical protein
LFCPSSSPLKQTPPPCYLFSCCSRFCCSFFGL